MGTAAADLRVDLSTSEQGCGGTPHRRQAASIRSRLCRLIHGSAPWQYPQTSDSSAPATDVVAQVPANDRGVPLSVAGFVEQALQSLSLLEHQMRRRLDDASPSDARRRSPMGGESTAAPMSPGWSPGSAIGGAAVVCSLSHGNSRDSSRLHSHEVPAEARRLSLQSALDPEAATEIP